MVGWIGREAQAEQELIGGAPEAGSFGEMMGTYGPHIPATAKLVQRRVAARQNLELGHMQVKLLEI